MIRKKEGLLVLTKKTLAVITASISALIGQNISAQDKQIESDNLSNEEALNKIKTLKPQLILKMNGSSDGSFLAMHKSHSSHRSHSSHYSSSSSGHYSHTSHSSHYSSAPSYTPSNTVPYSQPSSSSSKPTGGSSSSTAPSSKKTPTNTQPSVPKQMPAPAIPSNLRRTLQKGCEGKDVEELQKLLVGLDFKIYVTGYFGEKTVEAVKTFQVAHKQTPDGIVTPTLFDLIKKQ